jgi:hypothetical protein
MYIEKGIYMKLKSNHETSFTSIHIFKDKYTLFKEAGVSNGMTLQKLVNRCVYLYTNDPTFKAKIDGTTDLQVSGSAF